MKLQLLRGVVIDSGKTASAGDKVEVSDKFGSYLIKIGKAKLSVVKKRAPKKSADAGSEES